MPNAQTTQIFLKNVGKGYTCLVCLKKSINLGVQPMATGKTANSPVADSGAKPPYAFRTGWALFLLAINFLVAAYYFNIIQ